MTANILSDIINLVKLCIFINSLKLKGWLIVKRIFYIICIILTLAVLSTSLNGCSSKKKSNTSQATKTTSSTVSDTASIDSTNSANTSSNGNTTISGSSTKTTNSGGNSTAPIAVVNNCYTTGYPIAKNPAKLIIMVKDYLGLTDYSNMAINQYFKDKFNISVTWQVVQNGQELNKMVLAYTSGNLPDIFMGMSPSGYAYNEKYIKQGLLLPLDTYIDKYAPNVKKIFSQQKDVNYLCTDPEDGKKYMLPMITRDASIGQSMFQLYINSTWLSNLGLKMPTTTAEYKSVLQKFKTDDPNGNGLQDEIPLAMEAGLEPCAYGPFGLSVYFDMDYVDNSGKIQFAPVSTEYRDALAYYKDLWANGLIDKDWWSTDANLLKLKGSAKVEALGSFIATNSSSVVGAARALKDYTIVPPLTGPSGTKTWTYTTEENVWPEWFMVTNACKYPEIAVRFADYFYSLEGTLVAMNGPPGPKNEWNYDSKGNPVSLIQKNLPSGWLLQKWQSIITPGYPIPHYTSPAYDAIMTYLPDASLTTEQISNNRDEKNAYTLYSAVKPENYLPKLNLTAAQNDIDTPISQTVMAYVNKTNGQFLRNEISLDNDWDTYITNLTNFGYKTIIADQQVAYDKYKSSVK